MQYKALYRQFRPDSFDGIVGQEHITKTLKNQVTSGKTSHAYLFSGPRGTGKTTAAKVLARAVNCEAPVDGEPCFKCPSCAALGDGSAIDVIEIDAASNNGVDEMRDLREKIAFAPSFCRYKVYIIDEVHMLSTSAFNALLKTLEEPPAHAVFILATTEAYRIPATILSRCQRFEFHRISTAVIFEYLKKLCGRMDTKAEDAALKRIARAAEGGLRDAISILDQCLSLSQGELMDDTVIEVLGVGDDAFYFGLSDAIIERDASRALGMVADAWGRGREPNVLTAALARHFRNLLIAQNAPDAENSDGLVGNDAHKLAQQARAGNTALFSRALRLLLKLEADLRWATMPRVMLEMTLITLLTPEAEHSIEALEQRITRLEGGFISGALIDRTEPEKLEESKAVDTPVPVEKKHAPSNLWRDISAVLRQEKPSLYHLLKPFGGKAEGDIFKLKLDEEGSIASETLKSGENIKLIEDLIERFAGKRLRLALAYPNASGGDEPAQTTLFDSLVEVFGADKVVKYD